MNSIHDKILCNNNVNYFWEIDKKQIFRTKNGITVYYSSESSLGKGLYCQVNKLEPQNPSYKAKAIKRGIDRFEDLKEEYAILIQLPQCEGLMLPPKAFFPLLKSKDDQVESPSFIVMPQYEGTLHEINGLMSSSEKIEALRQIINGLAFLHQQGICHCDLSLKNILFRKKKNKIRYDISDFGNSKIYKDEVNEKRIEFEYNKRYDIIGLFQVFAHLILGSGLKVITREELTINGFPPDLFKLHTQMPKLELNAEEIKKSFNEIISENFPIS